jgi:hypothetical protein
VVILFHRHSHRPVVNDRDHFAEVLGEQAVKQYFVAVVQGGQVDIPAQRIGQALVPKVGSLHLGTQGAHVRWEQAGKSQCDPFLRGEGRAFIEHWRI